MRVVLVIGLPGSGKSTWAKTEAQKLRDRDLSCRVIDDPVSLENVEQEVVVAREQCVHTFFVVDPVFCRSPVRDAAASWFERMGLTVEFVFFANDPESALRNSRAPEREAKSVRADVLALSRVYTPGPRPLPVWRGA